MPTITLTFATAGDAGLNTSVQVGDVAYYVTQIDPSKVLTWNPNIYTKASSDIATNIASPTTNDFIFFSKDNQANASGLIGYFAEIKFKNDSTTEAELFSVGSEFFESSK